MISPQCDSTESFETFIPARLERLPWSRFHWLFVIGLGITWVLDGLEVTLMGAVAAVLQRPDVLNLSAAEIGFISSCYLGGAVVGALLFGHLTDRFGRRRFFFLSLAIYLAGVGLTACSWSLGSFALFRFLTGAGIGGEYSAVNSAIDELIPARVRGRVDLIVNGSFWLGAAGGSAATLVILDPAIFSPNLGWRLGFAIGPLIGLVIIYFRRFIPESPRWLLTHGKVAEAEATLRDLEMEAFGNDLAGQPAAGGGLTIHPRRAFGLAIAARTILTDYRTRSYLALGLMTAQAFLYNAIFFTYALVLNRYYSVRPEHTGIYLFPLALGNFAGPLLLGRFFDTVGRRAMIAASFATAGFLLLLTGWLFANGRLTSFSQVALWTLMFFFASAAASSAYLTVSEIFPLEIRALAIAIFYSAGTAVGGVLAPWFFGELIDSGSREMLFLGYSVAAALMIGAAMLEVTLGVDAERCSLEEIAAPLSSLMAKD
jgi:MFS family permease